MTKRNENMNRAMAILAEMGQATRYELEQRLGITKQIAANIVGRMCRPMERGPYTGKRRAHICGWTRYVEGTRYIIRPVYALGDKPDKPYPGKIPQQQINREHWQKRKAWKARTGPGKDLQDVWLGR